MEQITWRIVKDAEIRRTHDNREFVVFTVAINDRYKPMNKDEVRETRYFSCSYWVSTTIKEVLRKGAVVSVFGRVNINAYKGTDGEYHANLTFHANNIEVIATAKREAAAAEAVPAGTPETKDDLPF